MGCWEMAKGHDAPVAPLRLSAKLSANTSGVRPGRSDGGSAAIAAPSSAVAPPKAFKQDASDRNVLVPSCLCIACVRLMGTRPRAPHKPNQREGGGVRGKVAGAGGGVLRAHQKKLYQQIRDLHPPLCKVQRALIHGREGILFPPRCNLMDLFPGLKGHCVSRGGIADKEPRVATLSPVSDRVASLFPTPVSTV